MKDVSWQTMEDLIAYIYTGEVTVKHESLASLLAAGKSLEINGLTNEHQMASFDQKQSNRFASLNGPQRTNNGHQSKPRMEYPSTSNGYQSKRNIVEYRSTQTNQIKNSPHTCANDDVLIEPKVIVNEENVDIVEYTLADVLIQGDSNYSNENNCDQELLEFLLNNDETLINGICDGQENDGKMAGSKTKAPENINGPKRKRPKRKFGK